MTRIEFGSGVAGAAAGFLAVWLSMVSTRRLGDDGFWRRLASFARAVLAADGHVSLLAAYVQLWRSLMVFLAKKLVIAMVGLSPVVLTFACLAPLARARWDAQATHIEVAPPQQLCVERAGHVQRLDERHFKILREPALDGPAIIVTSRGRLRCATLLRKQAYTPHWYERWLLGSLGFEILEPDPTFQPDMSTLIARPSRGDRNPLWPYLSDWEFAYFAAVCLAFGIGVLVPQCKQSTSDHPTTS
jgi:hypothetical protein